jgi:hypothetical protein
MLRHRVHLGAPESQTRQQNFDPVPSRDSRQLLDLCICRWWCNQGLLLVVSAGFPCIIFAVLDVTTFPALSKAATSTA